MKLTRLLVLPLVLCLINPACTPDPGGPDDTGNPGSALIATFTIKKIGLKATFDASGATADGYPASDIVVRWDYTNDGTFDTDWSATKTSSFTYAADGTYTVRLEIKDPKGGTDSATKLFTIAKSNVAPTATFNVNIVKGMTASLDASSSSDAEDPVEDLQVRWDFNGDNTYDTDWSTVKTAEHTYPTAGEYTVKLQVKDLNEASKYASQTVIASPITIRNSFITYGPPYKIGLHFRMINNITGQVVTPADVPALTRAYFTISEDNLPIDLSETNQILYNGKRPMYLVLLLDFTGSMYDSGGVPLMLEAARQFIANQGDTTYVSLWAFWDRHEHSSTETPAGYAQIDDYICCTASGRAKLQADLDTFAAASRARGATQVWDVLDDIIKAKFPKYDTGINRGIVFLSDGHDTSSITSVGTLITRAREKAAFMFSVGLAFRPQEYPADEPNLKKIAEDTGGLYFTVNQITDLSTVFGQLSEDVNADWTLSYITLKSTGTHTVKTVCNYLDGYATMTGKFPVTNEVKGDVNKGLLLVIPSPASPAGTTEYAIWASYIPRDISTFQLKASSPDAAVSLALYGTDTICNPAEGWTLAPDTPAAGWYTLGSSTPLEFGSWGRIAKCTIATAGTHTVTLELPALVDQGTLYGDKTILFAKTNSVTLTVP